MRVTWFAGGVVIATVCATALASCVDDLDANYGRVDSGTSAEASPPGVDGGRLDAASVQDALDGFVGGDAAIVLHGQTTARVAGATSSLCSLGQPSQSTPGDLLVAALLFGNISATGGTTVTAPTGWTELGQPAAVAPDKATLFVYWAVAGGNLQWPAVWQIGGVGNTGVAWLSSYGGVDTSTPPAFNAGQSTSSDSMNWPSPTLPAAPGDVIVATFGGFAWNPDGGTAIPTWSLPATWTSVMTMSDAERRSGIVGQLTETVSATAAQVTAQASGANLPQYVTAGLLVLKPR
ncbi:MAG TPA: hypothetical protein VMI75_27230 [Polyangiaceae bacterium]|nr:hypothetical protein [Polyangiaceae bacterium]